MVVLILIIQLDMIYCGIFWIWVCILNWVDFGCGFRFVYKIRLELWDIKFRSNEIYFNLSCFGFD